MSSIRATSSWLGRGIPLPDHRTGAGADPPDAASLGGLDISPIILILIIMFIQRVITYYIIPACSDASVDPWRYSTQGISVALRVTPRGGRDEIDGLETLANGRTVVKMRVRAIAEGGGANRAVAELLANALGVPKAKSGSVRHDVPPQTDCCRRRSGKTR